MAASKNNRGAQAKAGATPAKTDTEAEQKAAAEKAAAEQEAAAEKAAADAKEKAAEQKAQPTPVLMIRSTRKGGHRRAGMRWTREPIGIEVAALTEQQREQLEDDPNIVMEEAEADL